MVEKIDGKILPATVIDAYTFSVAMPINERLFVYSKKVTDILTVDYDTISMLNVSATQELYKLLKGEKFKNQLLAPKVLELQNQSIQTDFEKLKASVETMQQILGNEAQK